MKTKKWGMFKVSAASVLIIVSLLLIYLGTNSYIKTFFQNSINMTNEDFTKAVSKENDNYKIVNDTTTANIQVRDEKAIYKDMHEMANTKIIAEDGEIWGRKEINEELCNALIVEVIKSKYEDKKALSDMLIRWKAKDFSKIVDDHNYLWDKLDGTIGRAIKVAN